jgi:hypothetical protein
MTENREAATEYDLPDAAHAASEIPEAPDPGDALDLAYGAAEWRSALAAAERPDPEPEPEASL